MSIVKHSSKHRINEREFESNQIVECDFCHAQADKPGCDIGWASELARKQGFDTIKIIAHQPGDALLWWCGKCIHKNIPKVKLKGASIEAPSLDSVECV